MAKAKRWKDGKEFYTKSLAAISQDKVNQTKKGEEKCSSQPSADEEAGIRKGKDVEEACYVNRALCNLELSMQVPRVPYNNSLPAHLFRKLSLHDP